MLLIAAAQLIVGLCLLGIFEGYKTYFFNTYLKAMADRQKGEKEADNDMGSSFINPLDIRWGWATEQRLRGQVGRGGAGGGCVAAELSSPVTLTSTHPAFTPVCTLSGVWIACCRSPMVSCQGLSAQPSMLLLSLS